MQMRIMHLFPFIFTVLIHTRLKSFTGLLFKVLQNNMFLISLKHHQKVNRSFHTVFVGTGTRCGAQLTSRFAPL